MLKMLDWFVVKVEFFSNVWLVCDVFWNVIVIVDWCEMCEIVVCLWLVYVRVLMIEVEIVVVFMFVGFVVVDVVMWFEVVLDYFCDNLVSLKSGIDW